MEETLEVLENGILEADWKYWAGILPVMDHEGNPVSEDEEDDYWSVKSGFRETEVNATNNGDLEGTVRLTTSQTRVYEGGEVVYTLTRTGEPMGLTYQIGVSTSEENRESGGDNPSEQTDFATFKAWETSTTYSISAYVDSVAEDGTDTLKTVISNTGFGYEPGSPKRADVEINDPSSGSTLVTVLASPTSIVHRRGGSQNTSTISFTRSGGDTTQELTINVRVDDDNGYLRGNYWDPAPEIPTEVTFAANSTTAAMPLTVPDDQRDLPAAGLVTVQALPGDDCLLGRTGVTTSVTISASDNDTSQQLKFNWGWLDFLDDSWETGESYTRCVTNEDNEYICTERHHRRGHQRADRNSAHRHRIYRRVPQHLHLQHIRQRRDRSKDRGHRRRGMGRRGRGRDLHGQAPALEDARADGQRRRPMLWTGDSRVLRHAPDANTRGIPLTVNVSVTQEGDYISATAPTRSISGQTTWAPTWWSPPTMTRSRTRTPWTSPRASTSPLPRR